MALLKRAVVGPQGASAERPLQAGDVAKEWMTAGCSGLRHGWVGGTIPRLARNLGCLPEPPSAWMLLAGLAGLAGLANLTFAGGQASAAVDRP